MSKAAINQAFDVVTVRQVASAVDCDRRTVRTVRDKGRVARTVIGRTIAQALAAMSGVPVSMIMAPDGDGPADDVAEPETPADPDPAETGDPDEYTALAGKRIEDWKIAKLNRIAKERNNAIEAGDLLDLETVSARISQAGVAFQKGQAAARRSIEAVCCDGCRDAVVVEFDEAMNATIIAVRGASEGGPGVAQGEGRLGRLVQPWPRG